MNSGIIKQIVAAIAVSIIFSTVAYSQDKTKDRTLAIVNNEPIMYSEFERVAEAMIDNYKKSNPEISEEKISKLKQTILDEMINNKLIIQESKKDKITVSQRMLDEQITKIKKNFESDTAFRAELRKEGLTEEKFKDRIKEQMMAEELTYREVQSKVVDPAKDETDNLFDMLKKKVNGEKLDISEQESEELAQLTQLIDKYLKNKKAQDVYAKWMAQLRLKANLKINSID